MRKTIILLLMAIGLASYVYFYEIKGGQERKKEKEATEKLFTFNKDSVNFLKIHSPKGDFIFQKKDGKWRITRPVSTGAQGELINTLLSTLSSTKKKRTFHVKPEKLKEYGLAQQALRINFNGKGHLQGQIKFGGKTSVGENMYVALCDTVVYLIPSYIKTQADKSLFDWRDKRTVHFKKDAVREIHLKSPQGYFVFIKDGANWKITQPLNAEADKVSVNALLSKLDYGRIKSIVEEKTKHLKKYHLNKPAYRIELFSGSDKAETGVSFSVLKDKKAFGKDDVRPQIFTVDAGFLKPFQKTLFDFRSKKITEFERSKADSLILTNNDTLMTFVKDTSATWQFASGQKAKSWQVKNILSALSNLKAVKFVAEKAVNLHKFGLDKPKRFLRVFAAKKLICDLEVGRKTAEQVYARNTIKPQEIVTIKAERLKRLFLKKKDLQKKETKTAKQKAGK